MPPHTPALVALESPLRGDYDMNRSYARACMRDALGRGEAPFAMHLLYAQEGILDDRIGAEREMGIAAGLAWSARAERVVLYTDLGISEGMERAIKAAEARGIPVIGRSGIWNVWTPRDVR
jgi:hypothetical protein